MVSHSKKRIILFFVFGLLDFGHAIAADNLIIRGDQSTSLLHEVPLSLKPLPDWFFKDAQSDSDAQLKSLLSDIEFFTRAPENALEIQKSSKAMSTDKPISTPASGASP